MNPAQFVIILGLRLYRNFISPFKSFLFGPVGQCRFSPSCSCYAMESVHRHGAFAGAWLAFKRLLRCNPWGGAGHDPVPPKIQFRTQGNKPDEGAFAAKSWNAAAPTAGDQQLPLSP